MTSVNQYFKIRKDFTWARLLSPAGRRWGRLSFLVLALAVSLAGCGGAIEPPDRAPVTPPGIAPVDMMSSPASAPASSSPSSTPTESGAESGSPGSSGQAKPGADQAQEKAEPLPEKIADWKKDDYLRAKKDRDRRLSEAVMYLGEHFAGTPQADSAAGLLASLLKQEEKKDAKKTPGASSPPASSESSSSGMDYPSGTESSMPSEMSGMDSSSNYGSGSSPATADSALTKAIVYALGATRSDAGRDVLKQVLAGTFDVEDDRTATTAALESLAFYTSPPNEAILLEVVTAPENVRKPQETPKAKTPEREKQPSQPQPERPPGFEAPGAPGSSSPDGTTSSPESDSGMSSEMYGSTPYGGSGQQGAGAKMSPQEMQRLALQLVQKAATEQLRTKMATILVDKSIPDTVRAQVGGFLLRQRPDNAPAQMIFYRSDVLDAQSKEALVGYFTSYSSDALGAILGIPPEVRVPLPSRQQGPGMMPGMDSSMPGEPGMSSDPGMGGMTPGAGGPAPTFVGASAQPGAGMPAMESSMPYDSATSGMDSGMYGTPGSGPEAKQKPIEVDADLGYRIASQLWHGDFARGVAERLDGLESLSAGAPRIVMASTMPLDGMRAKLYGVLSKNHTQGPAAIESAGLLSSVIFEPGFLAVVKSLPREDPPAARNPAGMNQPQPSRRRGRPAPEGQPQGGAEIPEWQQKQQAAQDWMRASENLMRVLCGRLAAASERGLNLGAPAASQEPPLEIPSDAQITAQYTLEWPTEAAKKMAGVPLDPMKIQYVRVEQTGNPKTVLGFYRRKMSSPVIHELGPDVWAESFRTVPKTDRKLSLDVLISSPQLRAQAEMQPGAQPESSQQPGFALGPAAQPAPSELNLVVEILSLEVKDPAPPEKE